MLDSEIIKKINECLTLVHRHFDTADRDARHNAPDAAISEKFGIREWWLHEYRKTSGNQYANMFSFNADDILRNNIPSYVVGCSGRADLFAKYARECGLDVRVVAMVDTASKKQYPDGHQIIAVKFPNGLHMIDPGGGRTTYERAQITGQCKVGAKVYYNRRDGQTEYKITAILTPDEHAQIDRIEKLADVYKQGTIRPSVKQWQSGVKSVLKKIMNLDFVRSQKQSEY
ncbi:MAG: hypothetical protein IJX89_02720 [Alphaproteobacteria bacterium]|nr:hypothetical protein [Alphaproteobacteria bacterium]